MNILILNWRDIKNPESGGAEVLTHEVARRWVLWGHQVTQLSACFPGSKQREILDGIEIIRRGWGVIRSFRIPVHVAAYFWYQHHGRDFDVVIDEIHGIPFFSPLYVKQPIVALICEVAKELWDIVFPLPINSIGHFVENNYFRFYKHIPFLTISPSTQRELAAIGISSSRITILPMGITIPHLSIIPKKEHRPTIIYVGRITKAKGVEDAIIIADSVRKDVPAVQLWIIGQGDAAYVAFIRNLINRKRLNSVVRLLGFVSEEDKFTYLARAHLLIAPSYKEGWGLTVPEAGSVGTPAVAYNIAGFRDILRPHCGGILVARNTTAMSTQVIKLLRGRHGSHYQQFQREAKNSARAYNWDDTARCAFRILDLAMHTGQ